METDKQEFPPIYAAPFLTVEECTALEKAYGLESPFCGDLTAQAMIHEYPMKLTSVSTGFMVR